MMSLGEPTVSLTSGITGTSAMTTLSLLVRGSAEAVRGLNVGLKRPDQADLGPMRALRLEALLSIPSHIG
jgi:hypothetical protein